MKLNLKIVILSLATIFAVLCLVFLIKAMSPLFESSANPESENQPACGTSRENTVQTKEFLADVTKWQTYRNDQYGFEIKYPGYNFINEASFSKPSSCGQQLSDSFNIVSSHEDTGDAIAAVGYDITVNSNSKKNNANDFALCKMQEKYTDSGEIKINSVDNITIGEQAIKGTKIAFSDLTVMVLIPANENFVEIDWLKGGSNLTEPKELDQMLATFKFAPPDNSFQSIEKFEISPYFSIWDKNNYEKGAKAVVYADNLEKVEFRQRGSNAGNYTDPEGYLVGVGTKIIDMNGQERWEMIMPSNGHCWFYTLCALGFDAQGNKTGESCLYNVNDFKGM